MRRAVPYETICEMIIEILTHMIQIEQLPSVVSFGVVPMDLLPPCFGCENSNIRIICSGLKKVACD